MNKTPGASSATYAVIGNGFIAVLKLIGFLMSGSAALLAEVIHSFADTANQALLLVGVRLSKRKADAEHTYGYGSERFLWALISACGIFFVGAGVTIYHGVSTLYHAEALHFSPYLFLILAIAFVVESFTLYLAYRELRRLHPELSLGDALSQGDPVTVAVVYEDTAAVFGVIVAAIGIALSYMTGDASYDAYGSIGVGLILGWIALFLINKNRKFLLGKAIPEEMKEEIIEALVASPYIERVLNFQSEVLDIGRYHVKCEIEFNGAALLEEIMAQDNLREEYEALQGDYEEFKKFVVYQTNRVPRLIGRKIDEIEKKITGQFPQIKSLDLEIN